MTCTREAQSANMKDNLTCLCQYIAWTRSAGKLFAMRRLQHRSDLDSGHSVNAASSIEVLGDPSCTSRGSTQAPAARDYPSTRSNEGLEEDLKGIGADLDEETMGLDMLADSCLTLDEAGREGGGRL